MNTPQPTPRQKRAVYATAFCIALGVDVAIALVRDVPYRPSLVGLAIMIAAVLWFVASLIRER